MPQKIQKKTKKGVDGLDTPCYIAGMPNQRAANKKQFGVTLTKEEVARIDAAAAALGITRTEFIRQSALAALAKAKEQSKKEL